MTKIQTLSHPIYTDTKFAFMKSFPLVCQTCQKTFYVYNSFYVNTRPIRFCSSSCGRRKIKVNEDYFETITDENLHTFGQVIATSFVSDYRDIIIKSDQSTLEKIQTALQSNYKARPADLGKFQVKISSDKMVNFLLSHGLSTNKYFQEFPPYDILTGLLDTDCYKKVDGVQTFRTPSSKLALEVCYLVGGEIITETYKDVPKGVLGCDWVVVW